MDTNIEETTETLEDPYAEPSWIAEQADLITLEDGLAA